MEDGLMKLSVLRLSGKEKSLEKERLSARRLIGVDAVGDHSLWTPNGELVFFNIRPANLSTLSEESIRARIYALMTVLKGLAEIEMLCVNSRENFESNKRFMKSRMEAEDNPALRKLLQQDMNHLDRIQAQTATAREFFIIIRLGNEKGTEKRTEAGAYLSRIEKSLSDQGFAVRRADDADLKKLLGVYFEQNVTTEKYEDFDGERWVILNE
jgi:hypothetical protein